MRCERRAVHGAVSRLVASVHVHARARMCGCVCLCMCARRQGSAASAAAAAAAGTGGTAPDDETSLLWATRFCTRSLWDQFRTPLPWQLTTLIFRLRPSLRKAKRACFVGVCRAVPALLRTGWLV